MSAAPNEYRVGFNVCNVIQIYRTIIVTPTKRPTDRYVIWLCAHENTYALPTHDARIVLISICTMYDTLMSFFIFKNTPKYGSSRCLLTVFAPDFLAQRFAKV